MQGNNQNKKILIIDMKKKSSWDYFLKKKVINIVIECKICCWIDLKKKKNEINISQMNWTTKYNAEYLNL